MPKTTFANLPEAKRQAITTIALEEFAANPYQAVSISRIVARAQIAKGSFYQYFEDKKDLYFHLLNLGLEEKASLFKTLRPDDTSLKLFPYLRWLFEAAVQFELQHPLYATLAYRAFYEESTQLDDLSDRVKQGGSAFFNDLLAQGITHDDVAPWVDTEMAAFILRLIFFQLSAYLMKRVDQLDARHPDVLASNEAQQLFDNLMEIIEGGMARDPHVRKIYTSKA